MRQAEGSPPAPQELVANQQGPEAHGADAGPQNGFGASPAQPARRPQPTQPHQAQSRPQDPTMTSLPHATTPARLEGASPAGAPHQVGTGLKGVVSANHEKSLPLLFDPTSPSG